MLAVPGVDYAFLLFSLSPFTHCCHPLAYKHDKLEEGLW